MAVGQRQAKSAPRTSGKKKPAPRIKAAPKRARRKTVHVKTYCRRKAEAAWKKASKQAREWGF